MPQQDIRQQTSRLRKQETHEIDMAFGLDEGTARRLLLSPPGDDFIAALKEVLKERRRPRWLTIRQVAEISGKSVRTVQRLLAAENTTFSSLVDDVRQTLSLELLRGTQLSIKEVAVELGYTESPNFSRAFKRWIGVTPNEFRRDERQIVDDT